MLHLQKFEQLLTDFYVPRRNAIATDRNGQFKPIRSMLFAGHDPSHRAFINLPIILDASPEIAAEYVVRRCDTWKTNALVVFQATVPATETFDLVVGPPLQQRITGTVLLGDHYNDLTKLHHLLSGKSLRCMINTINWIDITLDPLAFGVAPP